MIIITNIKNANKEFDENWAIVRSMKNKSSWIAQVAELSPTKDLFYKYLQLRDAGNWNRDAFNNIYVPQFIKELKENAVAKNKLNYLYKQDKTGKTISLSCFCPDETLCHRSIIAGLLSGVGCNVTTDTGQSYTQYYDMYKSIN